MYNQAVTSTDGTTWTYTPIKYWPNDFSNADVDANNNPDEATGSTENGGKVSFFAYAPYVDFDTDIKTEATEDITGYNDAADKDIDEADIKTASSYSTATGIIARTLNTYEGHPYLQYRLASLYNFSSDVDLLWGTTGTIGDKAVGGAQAGTNLLDNTKDPKVNVNLTKMKTGGKIGFAFKHALALVGGKTTTTTPATPNGLTIQLDPDEAITIDEIDGTASLPTTKVTVTKIEITNDVDGDGHLTSSGEGVYKDGVFNLATGQWKLGTVDTSDGLKYTQGITGTGTVGSYTSEFALNSKISENGVDVSDVDKTKTYFKNVSDKPGVTGTKQAVYVDDATVTPLVFIPGTTPKLKFTITYTVRTYDKNLASYRSEVVQTISKIVTFAKAVELNKKYNINIKLGLTSVKFDATVESWSEDTDNDTDVDDEDDTVVNLPLNVTSA